MKKVKVLVVDDSAFMRKAIKRMLAGANDIEVVGTAADGREALARVAELRPDLVTLDVKMAGMNGITALELIMREHATPVIMLSSLTQEGAEVTLKALELGAVDFIDKTRAESPMDITLLANELIAKVRAVAGVDINKVRTSLTKAVEVKPEPRPQASPGEGASASARIDVVALGTSTGGPPALHVLIPKLPRNFPAGMIVVQHMPVGFTRTLAERLNAQSELDVVEAAEGDEVRPGRVLIAPAGHHVNIRRSNGRYLIHLSTEPAGSPHKPSVDVMMESVAKACGKKSLGVLLTGMGNDGVRGMRAIKEAGGRTLAESEETCIIYGMPKSAVDDGVVDKVVPLHRMAADILKEM
ncbi:MAG TPA: chemotaxis response regulator protein-glutamate methylesterase [Nitrospirota bacterium]